MNYKKGSENGFTLVELAISMIIIGLLIVAILAGSAIIKAARVRSVINDVSNYQSAFDLFTAKYGAMPGDIADITSSISGTNLLNGNGDTEIMWNSAASGCTNSVGATVSCSEGAQAWNHMAAAGMLPGGFTGNVDGSNTAAIEGSSNANAPNIPASKIPNAGYSIDYSNGAGSPNDTTTTGNHLRFATVGTTLINSGPALSAIDARSIDLKTDDGVSTSGRVQETGLAGCSSAGVYTLTNDTLKCAIDIQLDSSTN